MKKIVLLTLLLLFSGCSTRVAYATPQEKRELQKLYTFYNEWEGTPFVYGGTSREGLDASAFVQIAYKEVYDLDIPRTTKEQVQLGTKVTKKQLRVGDLIFSKTGKNERHVGIYLQDGEFMLVSSIKGVHISSIDNPYWKKHFWMAKRLK